MSSESLPDASSIRVTLAQACAVFSLENVGISWFLQVC